MFPLPEACVCARRTCTTLDAGRVCRSYPERLLNLGSGSKWQHGSVGESGAFQTVMATSLCILYALLRYCRTMRCVLKNEPFSAMANRITSVYRFGRP